MASKRQKKFYLYLFLFLKRKMRKVKNYSIRKIRDILEAKKNIYIKKNSSHFRWNNKNTNYMKTTSVRPWLLEISYSIFRGFSFRIYVPFTFAFFFRSFKNRLHIFHAFWLIFFFNDKDVLKDTQLAKLKTIYK